MIKEHPFTTLCEILRSGNDEVMNIFNQYAVRKNTPIQPPPHFRELILTTKPIMKDDAKERIKTLIAKISECGDNYFAVFQEMSNVLTADGIGKILALMGKDKIDEFLDGENIQYLFKGMPVFKIRVVDQKWRRTRAVGRYDIYFEHSGNAIQDDIPIKFDTAIAKALYLLFLMMPRKKVDITQYDKVLKELIMSSFDYDDETFESDYNAKDFKVHVKDNKPIANRNIEASLKDRDEKEWYIIDINLGKDKYYSLSLPKEMIELPEELKEFQKNYINTISNSDKNDEYE